MKKVLFFLVSLLLVATSSAQSQSKHYLWPIEGAEAGENIISAPHSYLGNEFNYGDLFIGAPEGTTVRSPVDGKISQINVGYMRSLTSVVSCSPCLEKNFDESMKNSTKFDIQGGQKYFHGCLGISTKDGKIIFICGLRGNEMFKIGQAVKRGEPIGTVAYSYFKIEEPSIMLSIDFAGKAADPMTPFGLKSSFLPVRETIKPVLSLTKKRAIEDFMIYIDVLKETYPGLYDVVTKSELDEYVHQTIDLIESKHGDLQFSEFQKIMKGAVSKIHDSHIYLLPLIWETEQKTSPPPLKRSIEFGFINDTLVCTNTTIENKHFINRRIKSVNGMSADSIRKTIISTTSGYDAKVESYLVYHLALASYFIELELDLEIEFNDGETVHFLAVDKETTLTYSLDSFNRINKHTDGHRIRFLSSSTAYIGLSSFNITQVHEEKIADFINSISNVAPNLIIDLRNNGGGAGLGKLFSYIAGDSLVLNSYSRVNRINGYESFKYSLNRTLDDDVGFSNYVPEEGKEGFFHRSEKGTTTIADSMINYKGNVYVLVNELSASAATLFTAMLVRNDRCTVVGRETRTAFHFMNAVKFADICLPNSIIRINIPLVQHVFDTVVDGRTPYGRGVLPDYHVPLTIDELSFKNGDAILKYTLKLIEDREVSHDETEASNIYLWMTLILLALLPVFGYLLYKYKYKPMSR